MPERATKALAACAEYDRWEREVTRLTSEIGDCHCPQEEWTVDEDGYEFAAGGLSCFAEARRETAPPPPDDPGLSGRPISLDTVAERVADCPDCSRLCNLIRQRREARKQVGIAKRRCRLIGRHAQQVAQEDAA